MCSDPTISVIIPLHNGRATIGRALDSLLGQEFAQPVSVEAIIVDDGSSDGSAAEIDRRREAFAAKGIELTVITHPKALGSSAAQRAGMKAARGRYLARIDHDDAIPPRYLAELLTIAETTGASIAVAPYVIVDPAGKRGKLVNVPKELIAPQGVDLNKLYPSTVNFSLCNKLITRELIDRAGVAGPLAGVDCWDDLSMMARLYALSPRVATSTAAEAYEYTVDPKRPSLSRSSADKLLKDRTKCATELDRLFAAADLDERYAPFLLALKLIAKARYLTAKPRSLAAWRSTFPETRGKALSAKLIPLAARIVMAIADRV